MTRELVAMQAAEASGYPTVRALAHRPEGLVLDKVTGPSMLADLTGHAVRLRRHARMLADLHRLLGAIEAPSELPSPLGTGTSLLHLDLHPDNVLLTNDGPVVIDWANAAKGPAGADAASTWLLLAAAAPPPSGRSARAVAAAGRRLFLGAFPVGRRPPGGDSPSRGRTRTAAKRPEPNPGPSLTAWPPWSGATAPCP